MRMACGAKIFDIEHKDIKSEKVKYLLGCDAYDINPPLCCRIMKWMGITCLFTRYFEKKLSMSHERRHQK